MKRIISLCLCAALMFAVTGCKKASAESIEQQISQQMADSKYLDAHVYGDINLNIPDAGMQAIKMDANIKADMNGEFPKMSIDGSIGVAGIMTLPMSMYMDQDQMTMNMLGQSQSLPFNEEMKQQIKLAMSQNNNVNTYLNKTVNFSTYNEQEALEIVYDTNQLNQLINSFAGSSSTNQDSSISKMQMYYLLKNKSELDSIVAQISMISGGEQIDMNFVIQYNSIGQPVDIVAPTTSQNSSPITTQGFMQQQAS